MNILISALSATPIYEQIKAQIKELALAGKLKAGEQLPSIRLMAKDLQVGIITVKRAYDELCEEGILMSFAGRGVFAAALDTEKIKQAHLELLRERLRDIRAFCEGVNITKEEMLQAAETIYEEATT